VGDGSSSNNPGWGNQELEWYTDSPDNAAMDGNGNLVITARQAPSGLTCYYGPCQYTSARLTTEGKLEFAYGRVEARIRIPAGEGLWPAFWMLGTNINTVNWPQSGETDIMENVGRLPNTLYGTIHGPGYSDIGVGGTFNSPDPLSAGYHIYSVTWQPGSISWAIDGTTYFTATRNDVPQGSWVFDHPFFLLLNVAVGGNFGGPVGSDTTFPQTMAVDYIRVYQAPDTAERFDASFTDNFTGWRRITLPFKSFTRSAQQPAGAPSGKLDLKEIWGYSFSVPEGVQNPVHLAQIGLTAKPAACKASK
jgi:beta-glucanase (GH16 family)